MNHVLNIPVEAQQKTLWCWAAVSTMAVRTFSTDPVLSQLTQLRTVACKRRGVRTKAALTQMMSDVVTSETRCSKPDKCNGTGVPWMLDVTYTSVPKGQKLSKQRLIDEILDDRPVIVMWDYTDVSPGERNLPTSTHYLLVTGYDDEADNGAGRFRVTDPWPTKAQETGEPEEHEHYVSYDGYVDPEVSLGLPVKAVHESDCYNLRRMLNEEDFQPDQPAVGDVEPIGQTVGRVLKTVDFDEILHLDSDIQANVQNRIIYAHDGNVVKGAKRAGKTFPIVGLTTRQILEGHDEAHRLLIPQALALVAPITVDSGDKVVDSLQMYRTEKEWKVGGYFNSRIATLMTRAADRLRREAHARGPIYLVSIPEQVTFFAASGEGAEADLISLDDDARGPVLKGKRAFDQVRKTIELHREGIEDRDPGPRR